MSFLFHSLSVWTRKFSMRSMRVALVSTSFSSHVPAGPSAPAVAAQERPGAVVHVVVAGAGGDQGGKVALVRLVRVAQVDEVDALDLQVGDDVAFVIAGQALELGAVLGVEVRHEQGLHRLIG